MILRFEIRTSSLRKLCTVSLAGSAYSIRCTGISSGISSIIFASSDRPQYGLTPGVPYVLSTSNNYARFEVGRAVRVGVASSLHACKPIRLGIDGIVPSCDGASHVKTGEARREAV